MHDIVNTFIIINNVFVMYFLKQQHIYSVCFLYQSVEWTGLLYVVIFVKK